MSDSPFEFDEPVPLVGTPIASGVIAYSSSFVDGNEKQQPAVSFQFVLADGIVLPPITLIVDRAGLGLCAGHILAAIDYALTTIPL